MESTSASSTSSSLLRSVQAGDADAWNQLAQVYAPVVYAWCRRAGLAEPDTLDVAQNVFSSVFKAIGRFRHDGPGDSFRGWLWRITRNEILMLARHRKGQQEAVGGTEAQQALAQLPEFFTATSVPSVATGRTVLARQAVEQLREEFEEHTWQAFWQTTVDGRPGGDVAAELGMTAGAVRQAKHRVLKRLRDFLADD